MINIRNMNCIMYLPEKSKRLSIVKEDLNHITCVTNMVNISMQPC